MRSFRILSTSLILIYSFTAFSPIGHAKDDFKTRLQTLKNNIEAFKEKQAQKKQPQTPSPQPTNSPAPSAPISGSLKDRMGAPKATVQVKVGNLGHIWNPLLGGVVWLPSKEAAKAQANLFKEYPGEILVAVKQDPKGFGYRFDLDFWEPNTAEYSWFPWKGTDKDATNLDAIFQIYGKPNVKFTLSLPMPAPELILGEESFKWQTPAFYGAMCQYLFGEAGSVAEYQGLPARIDFFKSPSINWANLRARRGQIKPYKVEAIILGIEPYYVEGWKQRGKEYGALAEAYRKEIRKRGIRIPYGVHVSQLPAVDREWFHPMMDQLDPKDLPVYFDIYHHYTFAGTEDWERSFPVAWNEKGFSDWWRSSKEWKSDYRRYLWIIHNTSVALQNRGYPYQNAKLGFSEHGITISSPFKLNDMKAAIHYALWLTETMVYGTQWDSMWTLVAAGFSSAQIQYVGGITTRTPTFYVYQLAMKLRGMKYLATSTDTMFGTANPPKGDPVLFPWVVARVLENSAQDRRFVFAINQHSKQSVTLQGLNGWSIESWEEVRGSSYSAQNPIDQAGPEKIKVVKKSKKPLDALTLEPISINLITLKKT